MAAHAVCSVYQRHQPRQAGKKEFEHRHIRKQNQKKKNKQRKSLIWIVKLVQSLVRFVVAVIVITVAGEVDRKYWKMKWNNKMCKTNRI